MSDRTQLRPGYPIRKPWDHSSVDNSPRHIAASHVLHRPLVPRHPHNCPQTLDHKQDARNHYTNLNKPPTTTTTHPPRQATTAISTTKNPNPTPPPPHPRDGSPHKKRETGRCLFSQNPDRVPSTAQPAPHTHDVHDSHEVACPPRDRTRRAPHRHPAHVLPRKEVIQPHLPVRLPCYDFVPIASPTFDHSPPQRGLGHGLRVLPTFVT
jgi:hypothetical protein